MSPRILILAVALSAALGLPARAAKEPNILFIISDDQRWDCVGALGHPDVTPALDALARQGLVFHNCYCMGSMVPAVCTPSRTMLMSGRSLWHIPDPAGKWDGTPNLGKTFRDAGYETLFIGKKGNTYKAGNWKLIEYRAGGERNTQLFDLENDPDELKNLANDSAHATELNRLRAQLSAARKQFGDPVDWDAAPRQ